MGRGGHGGHGGFHGGHGGHGGLVGFVAGAVIRGAVAGAVIASTRRRPAYVHHRYSSRVVVVSGAGTRSRVIEVVCPAGLAPGRYVLQWRWDCEESDQVWANCADVQIVG